MADPSVFFSSSGDDLYHDLLDSAPDPMVIVDGSGHIVLVNSQTERLFGYSRDELIGKSVDMLVPQRFANHHHHRTKFFADPRARPMGADLDLFARRKDGSEFPVEISLSPIETPQGTLVSSAIRNITERKNIERALMEKNRQLQEADLTKDRFLAGMSHELRTPLNAIIGFTGTLLMKLPGPLTPDQEEQLGIVQSSARHLLTLINDILDLAKIESGKVELHFERVVVRQVMDEVRATLNELATRKGLEWHVHVPDLEVPIMTDRRAVRQILINLISNAIKYTPSGSVSLDVVVAPDNPRETVLIKVIDTGIGIRKEDMPKLFAAFAQLDAASNRRFEGVGLGLYLSNKLAKLLGGELRVSSVFGEGSTFALCLPSEP